MNRRPPERVAERRAPPRPGGNSASRGGAGGAPSPRSEFVLVTTAILVACASQAVAQPFQLPTANDAIFQSGGDEKFFVGTTGKPWSSGTFGCVRTEGRQMHEGLDIRCLQRDKRGEPTDAILASADGDVAYINTRSGLSNYGKYIVLRHKVDGLEIYSTYAHLGDIAAELKPGRTVKAGDILGTMGRTTNTREPITQDRAHLHFELNLLLNERFPEWYRKNFPERRNDHGMWNGQNLIAIDPREVLLAQRRSGAKFSLATMLRHETTLCRVRVRATNFPWLKRYPQFVRPNPIAEQEGIIGYDIALNFNGVPFEITPRAASEIKVKSRVQVLSVNEAEERARPCRHLVTKRGRRWELTTTGQNLFSLLVY